MSTRDSLYDTHSREIHLLENAPIQGRKTELRQLLKLLNVAKTGQAKAALITGDAGIGKTALVEAFSQIVREGFYCRILNIGRMETSTPEALYALFIEKLQEEASAVLDEALIAANEIMKELDLRWERQDLIRAIALVKSQEAFGGKEAVSKEQLVKNIRNQIPMVRKLKQSVTDSVEKLVDLITNPWVMAATALLNPTRDDIKEALREAAAVKAGKSSYSKREPARETTPASTPSEELDEEAVNAAESIIHLEAASTTLIDSDVTPEDEAHLLETAPMSAPKPGTALGSAQTLSSSGISAAYPMGLRVEDTTKKKHPLIPHLMNVLKFVNSAIDNIDSGLLITIDEWDRVLELPEREGVKDFLTELVYQIGEQKNFHVLTILTARNEGESYTLGGHGGNGLYNQFRTKLLLDPLNEAFCRKLVQNILQPGNIGLDDVVGNRIYKLSRGNPFWHLKVAHYMRERAEANRLKYVDNVFFDKLGIDQTRNILDLGFTRLKLAYLDNEPALSKVIAALLKQFGESVFSASTAIKEISTSQGFSDSYVFDVLRGLFRHDFIRQVNEAPVALQKTNQLADKKKAPAAEPLYTLQSRFVLEYLAEKTQAIQTDISTDEKLMYLKKIIPLSVKTGELDREKTMEVLALSEAMDNTEMLTFLEDTFTAALLDDKAIVRVTALNNLALIDTTRARDALFKSLKDSDSMVREYAARNLAALSDRQLDAALTQRVVDALIEASDDDFDAVRTQAYTTLAKFRWQRDLTSLFVKGLSDASEGVRLTSVRMLTEYQSDSPFVYTSLLDALNDASPDIRKEAATGLLHYNKPETIDALVGLLSKDEDQGIRALAADSLSRMEDDKAFNALKLALHSDNSEDVKLAVLRSLGRRRDWQTESILLGFVDQLDPQEDAVLVWATVRSLGNVGGSERSLTQLSELSRLTDNALILSMIQLASGKIHGRIDELRQLEKQLQAATPLTVAIPSEYREDVIVLEDEPVEIYSLSDPDPGIPDVADELVANVPPVQKSFERQTVETQVNAMPPRHTPIPPASASEELSDERHSAKRGADDMPDDDAQDDLPEVELPTLESKTDVPYVDTAYLELAEVLSDEPVVEDIEIDETLISEVITDKGEDDGEQPDEEAEGEPADSELENSTSR